MLTVLTAEVSDVLTAKGSFLVLRTGVIIKWRNAKDLKTLNNNYIPLYKSSTGQRTFHYRMVHIWNNLDSTLKTAKSISTFKFCLKNKLITDFLNSTLW